jgi:hypothetical protein
MFANTAHDVAHSPTQHRPQRAAPSFPAHPYLTNAEELVADGLVQHTSEVPMSTDDPFLSMADRIRAEGISEPDQS